MTGSTAMHIDKRPINHTHELVDLSDIPVDSKLRELVLKLSVSMFGEKSIPSSIMDYERICNHDDGYLCEHRLEYILNYIKKNFKE